MGAGGRSLLTTADAGVAKAAKTEKSVKTSKELKASGSVGLFLSQPEEENLWAGAKPAIDAEFYIYLTSASWCSFCNGEMPEVVEAYKKMREKGRVELILISGDRTRESAAEFAEKYKAEFPVLNPNGVTEKLPGYNPPSALPDTIFVDADGNVINKGNGSLIKAGAANTINHPDYANKSKAGSTKRKAAKEKKAADRKGGPVLAARGFPYAIFVGRDGKTHMEGGMSVPEQWENDTLNRRENMEA